MNIGVIFAGGSGQRMKSKDKPKQFLEVHGKPIIIYTLEIFENHHDIDKIVVSCKEDWIDYLQKLVNKFGLKKVVDIVPGGETGQMSIYNGLVAAKKASEGQKAIVLIHDGVRPFINEKTITDNIKSVESYGSAITTSIVKETILVVKKDESIDYVPDRAASRVAKAPQSFWLDDIMAAHKEAQKEGKNDYIDSCTMMKRFGHTLFLVDGPYENIKITTPDDFYTMRALLDAREDAQLYVGD